MWERLGFQSLVRKSPEKGMEPNFIILWPENPVKNEEPVTRLSN